MSSRRSPLRVKHSLSYRLVVPDAIYEARMMSFQCIFDGSFSLFYLSEVVAIEASLRGNIV